MVAHYGPMATRDLGLLKFAYTGVDLFFVITGYVFAPQLFGQRSALLEFAIRRFFRIYPLYVMALATYVGIRAALGQPTEHIALHLLFLHTIESKEIAFYFNPAFWSLPPEVEFYMGLPLLGLLIRRGARLWMLIAVATSVLVALAISRAGDIDAVNRVYVLSVHLPGLLIEFLLGAMAWRLAQRRLPAATALALLLLGVVSWLLLAVMFSKADPTRNEYLALEIGALAKPLVGLAAALCASAAVVGTVVLLRARAGVLKTVGVASGKLSYGIYLFHNAALAALAPMLQYLGPWGYLLSCVAATLAFSAVAHVLIEEPARRFGRWLGSQVSA